MATSLEEDDLIDVAIRLPRGAIEQALLSAFANDGERADRRYYQARALLSGLRRRATCFGGIRFGDPGWEMILELYVATHEGRHVAVSQLCSLSGASVTTALRHIEHLETLGYIARRLDDEDRRRINVSMLAPLQEAADRWLDLYFAALRMER